MLSVIKKIILYLIPNSFIKRRHFHSSTYKDNFLIITIFNNNFLRKILFRLAKLLKKYQISKQINYRLFIYQKIQETILESNNYPLYEIDYGRETRKAVITSTKEKLNFNFNVLDNQFIWFGVVLLEYYFQKFNIKEHDLDIKITIKNNYKNKIINLSFPTDHKKHGIAHINKGDSWVDISLNLKDFSNTQVQIVFEFDLINKSFLMFPERKDSKKNQKKLVTDNKGIAISNPTPYFSNKKSERILYISCESLTDPFWLEKIKYSKKINFKHIKEIISDSTYYKRSYSVADSTMPNIVSTLTGLSPLQHGFGNYNNSVFNSQFNEKIIFLPELLKKKNFTCAAYTVYGRFDPLYGFTKGFDIWSQVNDTFDSSAPSGNKITNAIEFFKNQDLFLYCHLNRLHGPMLNNGTMENPNIFSAESISDALNYNFENLYIDRLKILDNELGKIINYLKSNDLYENTTMIITGDHGAALPPHWKMGELKFPLYEHHTRVPLIIKKRKDIDNHESKIINYPISSQIMSFIEILKSQNLDTPKYFKDLFQNEMIDSKSAITEVVFHPKEDNYGISLVTENIKLFKLFKINWNNCTIDKIIEEKIFEIDNDGIVIDSTISKENLKNYDDINNQLNKIINGNINFYKRHPHKIMPNTIEEIL